MALVIGGVHLIWFLPWSTPTVLVSLLHFHADCDVRVWMLFTSSSTVEWSHNCQVVHSGLRYDINLSRKNFRKCFLVHFHVIDQFSFYISSGKPVYCRLRIMYSPSRTANLPSFEVLSAPSPHSFKSHVATRCSEGFVINCCSM